MAYIEGTTMTSRIQNNGGSRYLLLPPEVLEYLGIKDEDELLIKCEFSRKWRQPYIGVGKLVEKKR